MPKFTETRLFAPSRIWGVLTRFFAVLGLLLGLAFALGCLSGCSTVGYYWQSVTGHMAVINAARPVSEWLEQDSTPSTTKQRLALSQRIRVFASQELKLPDNASYTRYADLKRSAVVWNVVAAPPYSLQLKTWCFAVVGCVSYRGYYSEADAKAEAEKVKAEEGMEVNVYGVPAYSALGYLNWTGGDPLLSTFIIYPEGELARMLFHELAHQVLYVKDDTMFNESFATAVERIGGQLWLEKNGSAAAKKEYAEFDARRREFRALTLRTRERLALVYKTNQATAPTPSALAATESIATQKQQVLQQLRDEYTALKQSWGGYAGYDRFIAQANNASLGALAAYDELVPQFEAVFEKRDRNFKAFYDAIQSIVPLPKDERRKALVSMATMSP